SSGKSCLVGAGFKPALYPRSQRLPLALTICADSMTDAAASIETVCDGIFLPHQGGVETPPHRLTLASLGPKNSGCLVYFVKQEEEPPWPAISSAEWTQARSRPPTPGCARPWRAYWPRSRPAAIRRCGRSRKDSTAGRRQASGSASPRSS